MEEEEQLKLQSNHEDLFVSPSFSSYSADRFADIAAEVGRAVDAESGEEIHPANVSPDEDFEFSFVRCCDDHDLTTAELFGGDEEFREVFPIFNRDLLINNVNRGDEVNTDASSLQISLKKLFLEEQEGDHDLSPSSSSSSSEVDELEAIPSETYCVWKPKTVEAEAAGAAASPSTCKKSRSTGSGSKRWKLRDLLGRSNSDGKNAFVFLTPKRDQKLHKSEKVDQMLEKRREKRISSPAQTQGMQQPVCLRKRGMKQMEKRKSYLPYRKDLVGFFTSVNGIGRSFPPF